MSKLFIGSVEIVPRPKEFYRLHHCSGLAWHTDDTALRAKFEEYGVVEEAVNNLSVLCETFS